MKLTAASAGRKLIHFRGLGARSVDLNSSSAPTRPAAATANRKHRQVTFAGFGGGGPAAKAATEAWQAAHDEAEADRSRQHSQRRTDALHDECALTAGITKRAAVLLIAALLVSGSVLAQPIPAPGVPRSGGTFTGPIAQNGVLNILSRNILSRVARGASRDNIRLNGAMTATPWAVSTGYHNGDIVSANGANYEQQFGNTTCMSASTGGGPTGTGLMQADNTCMWNPVPSAVVANAAAPTITAGTSWATNHAYASGNITVTFTGSGATAVANFYTETVASCMSAATGFGPSGTGTGITDNTCAWSYLTTAPSAAFSGSSQNSFIWSGGSGKATTNIQYYGGLTGTSGGTNYETTLANTVNGVRSAGLSRYEFVTNSKRFVVRSFENAGSSFWRVVVCNLNQSACQYVNQTPYGTIGAWSYTIIDFSAVGGNQPRDIILENEGVGNFGGIDVLATEDIYLPSGGGPLLTLAVTGDSYPAGGGMAYGYMDYTSLTADVLGIRNLIRTAIGGCGYLVSCASGTAISRISDVTTTNIYSANGCPDILLQENGANDADGGFTPAQIAAAQTAYVAAFRAACGPSIPIFLTGLAVHNNGGSGYTIAVNAENAMYAAAVALNDPNVFFIRDVTDPQGSWQTGTGTIGASLSTATFATNVMTVTAMISGTHQIGEVLTAAGLTAGTKIISFGTGTGQTGTYNLSTSPGTIGSEFVAGASTNGTGNTDYTLEGQGSPQNLHPNVSGNRVFGARLTAAIRNILNARNY